MAGLLLDCPCALVSSHRTSCYNDLYYEYDRISSTRYPTGHYTTVCWLHRIAVPLATLLLTAGGTHRKIPGGGMYSLVHDRPEALRPDHRNLGVGQQTTTSAYNM